MTTKRSTTTGDIYEFVIHIDEAVVERDGNTAYDFIAQDIKWLCSSIADMFPHFRGGVDVRVVMKLKSSDVQETM